MTEYPCAIYPNWKVPKNIHALTTTRIGGISENSFNSFNLSENAGDNLNSVQSNRKILIERFHLPNEPIWLNQKHTNIVYEDNRSENYINPTADAIISHTKNVVCTVLTADCIPILICDNAGTMVSAIHAGWKGLINGIIENTLAKIGNTSNIIAWIGPAISSKNFIIDTKTKELFINKDKKFLLYLTPASKQFKFHADLKQIARHILEKNGVNSIYCDSSCTFQNQKLFYSYRRDGLTGRMASLIWFS